MDPNYSLSSPQIQAVLGEMATLTRMERGTLSEEYRTGACAPGADPVRLGPFYRHQLWEGGRNVSRRVPPEQVPGLSPAWIEEGLRAALLRDGQAMVEQLYQDPALFPDDAAPRPCETRHRHRPIRVQTLFGEITPSRS